MSPYQRAFLIGDCEDREAVRGRLSTHEYAMLEEMSFVRREAQAEADLAYADWEHRAQAEAYAVYRAAQDRADAAQDDLATLVRRQAA